MSNGLQVVFNPELNDYSIKDLDTLIVALETRVKAKEVMHPKEAAAYCGISVSSLYKSDLPFHNIPGLNGRVYLRSELVEKIKVTIGK